MSKVHVRATVWSVTINNPIAADEENIALARQKGWKVDGQLEKGQSGTQHYQLIVKTPQVRFSAVKKQFPRAHIEIARNVAALEQYVHKEETKEGELLQENSLYPSLQKLWDMLAEHIQSEKLHHIWIDADANKKLVLFDEFINNAILNGFVVETMAVNPQIRSCVKQYGENIYFRSLRRQTDRQTDENEVALEIINNADETQTTCSEESFQETLCEKGEVDSCSSSESSLL